MNECEYCNKPGKLRVSAEESTINKEIHICDNCWRLLKDPRTALPLLRGHLTLSQRNISNPELTNKLLNKFMEMVSTWKPKN